MAAPMVKSFEIGTRFHDSTIRKVKNFHARKVNSLAPPTRQSLKCIHLHNFGLVGPNFTNEVQLESLDHDKSNAPYDVNFRRTRFSAILKFYQKPLKSILGPADCPISTKYQILLYNINK